MRPGAGQYEPGERMKRQPSQVDIEIGNAIRIVRHAMGFSQAELADRIGISFQQLQKYERGLNRVSASRLLEIADVLGVTPSYLFAARPGMTVSIPDRRMLEAITVAGRIQDRDALRRWLDVGRSLAEPN